MIFSDRVCESVCCVWLIDMPVCAVCVCAGPKGSVAAASEAVKGY